MNETLFNENDTLKEYYPVLTGFKKAILPDNDVALNIDKRLFEEKFSNILLPNTNFVTLDELAEDSIGTLVSIHRTAPAEKTQSFFGHSLMRVKITGTLVQDQVAYVKIVEFPYENDADEDTVAVYGGLITSGIKKLASSQNSEKVYRELPTFDSADPNRWINKYAAAFPTVDTNDIFYTTELSKRLESVAVAVGVMLDRNKVKDEIEKKVQENIDKSQREYYLREELKVVNEELFGSDDERTKYQEAIDALNAPQEVKDKLEKELQKMLTLQTGSPESFVCKNYIDTVLALPWGVYSEETTDIEAARKILDEDHYGIKDVKERIVEYLAVHEIGKGAVTNILCLVGPPGVGKTSIVESIARALGRKYIRASLGGVHDEAEIRGHRRTYIGSMPGRIMAGIKKAGTSNPVFLLDEIDKLGADYKGDPSNALLEVLDPKQNSTFQDHYIDLPFDLSKVMFITTANSIAQMSRPLLDRMEIIEVGSYTPEEKLEIAKGFLLPKLLKTYGIAPETFGVSDKAFAYIIDAYTREAGVRRVEQLLSKILRKAAVKLVTGAKKIEVEKENVEEYLGVPTYISESEDKSDRVGVVHGLAWTENGGDTLDIECLVLAGKDKKIVTGNLGNVMKESVEIALSNARYYLTNVMKKEVDLSEKDIHVHFPDGAVPKDGPSAGAAISAAILSALSGVKVRGDIAITGEVSLSGKVIPIGGVKEKCLAALRHGITKVVLPNGNKKDIADIPDYLRQKFAFSFVENVSEVYELLLSL